MNNLFNISNSYGLQEIITSETSDLKNISFSRLFLSEGKSKELNAKGKEMVLVLQSGSFSAELITDNERITGLMGSRSSVFDELPTVIYLPFEAKVILKTELGCDFLIYSAESKNSEKKPVVIRSDDIKEVYSGINNWRRRIRLIFGPDSNITDKLIVGESVATPGSWIGFPAHKHDKQTDSEYPLEEIFHYKLDGAHGAYAIHHGFNLEKGKDEFYAIKNNNKAVAISEGYHTSLAAPGCRHYLLWGLAGKSKKYKLTTDPRFAWLEDAETLFEEGVGRHLGEVMIEKARE